MICISLNAWTAAFWLDNGMSVFLTQRKMEEIKLGLTSCRARPITPTTCKSGKSFGQNQLRRLLRYLNHHHYPQNKKGHVVIISDRVSIMFSSTIIHQVFYEL